MAGADKGLILWKSLRQLRWHQTARIMAALVLLDQMLSLTAIPSSEAVIVACVGALFAPIPTERRSPRDRDT